MRQLQKIRQYQRLYQHYGAEPKPTTIAEVAEVALCSERHARTLLRQLAQSGWLSWNAQPGRGHRALLHCLATTSELSAPLMHACLEKGDYQSALQLADGDPASLHHIITPFLGGKWLKHQPTLRIPWYRPLTSLHPALQRRRAEQHIICAVHAGLTRYAPGQPQPLPDLAHHWDASDDKRCWHFYLRSGAHWHNGQPISDGDILFALQQMLTDPARNAGLKHVQRVSLVAPWYLEITLDTPDAMLAHRLAHHVCRLPHPQQPDIGAGPFAIAHHHSHYLRLERQPWYFAAHPLLHAIEFWRTRTEAQKPAWITVGKGQNAQEAATSTSGGFAWLMMNANLPLPQAIWLRQAIQTINQQKFSHRNDLETRTEILPGLNTPRSPVIPDVPLPKTLTLVCYHTPELRELSDTLRTHLKKQGCELIIAWKDRDEWHAPEALEKADLLLGDYLAGELPGFALAEWFTDEPAWATALGEKVWDEEKQKLMAYCESEESLDRNLAPFFRHLLESGACTPLFHYRYRINTMENVQDIVLTAGGWLDFTRAWLPSGQERTTSAS
ncbi:SgrR family transcriptional regulator [Enterobacter oligotrophicus]|uniref:SgrR family transcriptional regulator n=1 Tax=Enterobacter TaxID=547 RepID=UPI001C0322FA|nr:SgrR family transcriptional regulator [Enterobacter oligotrophicus]ELW1648410.1 SgrR family transcriptional regulator [Enterobacter oligotrophicus]MBT9425269.1 SgrR family transcriptional regulator [Enterobacter oligotrophicus]